MISRKIYLTKNKIYDRIIKQLKNEAKYKILDPISEPDPIDYTHIIQQQKYYIRKQKISSKLLIEQMRDLTDDWATENVLLAEYAGTLGML